MILPSCVLPDKSYKYALAIPEINLKDQSTFTASFDLLLEKVAPSIALTFVYDNEANEVTGRFKLNDEQFIDFQMPENIYPVSATLSFILPSKWFKDKGNILFIEHLNGNGATISSISLDFEVFESSPYEN